MDTETACYVSFSVFPEIGPMRFKELLARYGSAQAAWKSLRKKFDREEYLRRLEKLHVSVLTLKNPKYPKLLSEISDAPFVLYIRGRGSKIDLNKTIAVVGTRRVTPYGCAVTKKLVQDLVAAGYTIVSGLAYGVDAVAHEAAIECGGKTIAVLGCGIDIIAPPSNASLYHRIENGGGAIISEMPLGLRPEKKLFVTRNRMISGLSRGVIVIEGSDTSGSLITARYAAEQGREVFAVPGPITSPFSKGPARLIKEGAKLVESVEDILDELNYC